MCSLHEGTVVCNKGDVNVVANYAYQNGSLSSKVLSEIMTYMGLFLLDLVMHKG